MANTLLTNSIITFETLRILTNNLKFAGNVYRGYDDQFAKKGAKVGATINVRKPPRFVGRTGAAVNVEDATDSQVPVTLDTQFGVDFTFSSSELALSVDDFSNRYCKPAAAAIANKIDRDGLLMAYQATANAVGTPGTVPNTFLVYAQAGQKMDEMGTPVDDERSLVINPAMRVNIVDALKGLFQSGDQIAKQYKTGMMGQAAGFNWYMDQNVVAHTVGPLGGTPLVNGAGQTGASLITNGWTAAAASRLKKGDVFTLAGVNAVNPQNRQSTGSLQQFVVTADVSSDGAGNATITISPSITPNGQLQNVSASPASGAALTVLGAASTVTPQGIAFHKNAFTLASADLEVPGGVDMGSRAVDKVSGVSLRFIRQYNVSTDQWISRFDVLYGWKPLYPELACRIAS